MTMRQVRGKVVRQESIRGGYLRLAIHAPEIAPRVLPGQFAHIRIIELEPSSLRRPLSIFKADNDHLVFLYKPVGRGTRQLARLLPGDVVDMIAPLGNGFPVPDKGKMPLLVAGGYGMAALYLIAERSPVKGVVFTGGRSAEDILCVDDFEAIGWPVNICTEDGSMGMRGMVTKGLDAWLKDADAKTEPEFFACGPNAMLKAIGDRAIAGGWTAWLSVDRHMACGVGACLTCVQRARGPDGEWTWLRTCREGPVFECRDVDLGEEP